MLNQKGFTLVEIIAVLIIMGILAAFAIPRFISLDGRAAEIALNTGVQELNAREKLVWMDHKLMGEFYSDEEMDKAIQDNVDLNIGDDYSWNGTTLSFRNVDVKLERIPSTSSQPAFWEEAGNGGKGKKKGWGKGKKPK